MDDRQVRDMIISYDRDETITRARMILVHAHLARSGDATMDHARDINHHVSLVLDPFNAQARDAFKEIFEAMNVLRHAAPPCMVTWKATGDAVVKYILHSPYKNLASLMCLEGFNGGELRAPAIFLGAIQQELDRKSTVKEMDYMLVNAFTNIYALARVMPDRNTNDSRSLKSMLDAFLSSNEGKEHVALIRMLSILALHSFRFPTSLEMDLPDARYREVVAISSTISLESYKIMKYDPLLPVISTILKENGLHKTFKRHFIDDFNEEYHSIVKYKEKGDWESFISLTGYLCTSTALGHTVLDARELDAVIGQLSSLFDAYTARYQDTFATLKVMDAYEPLLTALKDRGICIDSFNQKIRGRYATFFKDDGYGESIMHAGLEPVIHDITDLSKISAWEAKFGTLRDARHMLSRLEDFFAQRGTITNGVLKCPKCKEGKLYYASGWFS